MFLQILFDFCQTFCMKLPFSSLPAHIRKKQIFFIQQFALWQQTTQGYFGITPIEILVKIY